MGEGIRVHRLAVVVVECLIFLCRLLLVPGRGAAYAPDWDVGLMLLDVLDRIYRTSVMLGCYI